MIPESLLSLLERLCNAVAVSGDEGEVRQIVLEEVRPHADEVRVDALGNVLAIRRARSGDGLRVMLAAHMDEVGFMLVAEDGDGLYRFETAGSVDERYLVGKPVWVGEGSSARRDRRPSDPLDHPRGTRSQVKPGIATH
jgi:putative aminopeptidase FrvX